AMASPPAASVAAVGIASARLPQQGDTWSYRLIEPNRKVGPKERPYVAKIVAASGSAILEEYSLDGASAEWAHSPGAQLVGVGASVVSPYLMAFTDLKPGATLGQVQIVDPGCDPRVFLCQVEGKVIGREVVTVPAGRLE